MAIIDISNFAAKLLSIFDHFIVYVHGEPVLLMFSFDLIASNQYKLY
jgi:hypothetical protein